MYNFFFLVCLFPLNLVFGYNHCQRKKRCSLVIFGLSCCTWIDLNKKKNNLVVCFLIKKTSKKTCWFACEKINLSFLTNIWLISLNFRSFFIIYFLLKLHGVFKDSIYFLGPFFLKIKKNKKS